MLYFCSPKTRYHGRVARRRSAKPFTAVRFRLVPQGTLAEKSAFFCGYATATPSIIIARITNNTIVTIANILPKHPQFLSPSGNLSDNNAMTKPINGVNNTDKKNVQPNPILLLAPTNPTNAARKVSLSNPKIKSVKPIM